MSIPAFYTITYRLPRKTTRVLPYDYEITEHTTIDTIRKYIIDLNRGLSGDIELLYDGVVLNGGVQLGATPVPKYYSGIPIVVAYT